jgi:hypothetical protein
MDTPMFLFAIMTAMVSGVSGVGAVDTDIL